MNKLKKDEHTGFKKEKRPVKTALIIGVLAIVILVLGYHLLFPILGVTVAVTAGAWAIIVGTIVVMCIAGMLFFIIPGILILILSLFIALWIVLAITLFPFLFPVLIPLLIILLFLAFIRRRKYQK